MIFRGLFDLMRLLCSIAYSIVRDLLFAIVYVVGGPGIAIIVIAVLWWFGYLPAIAAALFG